MTRNGRSRSHKINRINFVVFIFALVLFLYLDFIIPRNYLRDDPTKHIGIILFQLVTLVILFITSFLWRHHSIYDGKLIVVDGFGPFILSRREIPFDDIKYVSIRKEIHFYARLRDGDFYTSAEKHEIDEDYIRRKFGDRLISWNDMEKIVRQYIKKKK